MNDTHHGLWIRHGECTSNQDEIFQAGDQFETDPLSPAGERQAEALAARFEDIPLEAILCTSYLRGTQTARAIARVTGAPILVPVIQADGTIRDLDGDDPTIRDHTSLLRELDLPSELAGLHFHDPVAVAIKDNIKEHLYEPDYHYSDEENLYDIWDRAAKILEYLKKRPEKVYAVVSHGGIIKACLSQILQEKTVTLNLRQQLEVYQSFNPPTWDDNSGVLSMRYDNDEGWTWLLADIAHLNPVYFNFMQPAGVREKSEVTDTPSGALLDTED